MKFTNLTFVGCKVIFLYLIIETLPQHARAQCGMQPEYMVVSATTNKCGYADGSTPPKYYLVLHYLETESGYWNSDVTGSGGYWSVDLETGSVRYNYVQTVDCITCLTAKEKDGNAHYFGNFDSSSGPSINDIDESTTWLLDSNYDNWVDYGIYGAADTFIGNLISPPETGTTNLTSTLHEESGSGPDFYGDWKLSQFIDTEFTDGMLNGKVKSFIPPFPTNGWTTVSSGANSFGDANYGMDANHYSAWGARMQYRFRVRPCQKDASYHVEWYEVTTTYANGTTNVTKIHMADDVTGTGDSTNGVCTGVHTVEMPSTPSTISESDWTMSPQGGSPSGN